MSLIILFIVIFAFVCIPFLRGLALHPLATIIYIPKDIYKYIRYCRWREYRGFGKLTIFNGLFGKGKTLSMTYYARRVFKKFNGKKVFDFKARQWKTQHIYVVSNVHFEDIPYLPLYSLNDMVTLSERENDGVSVYLMCVDEMSTQVNSREYKTNFSTDLLNVLLTCRHYRMELISTSQRFAHVDALVRQVTMYAVECRKLWRIVVWNYYDAWTVENTSDVTKVKPKRIKVNFIKDKDFNAYDTVACVESFKDNVKQGLHLTDLEIIEFQQQQLDNCNDLHLKRRYRKKLH